MALEGLEDMFSQKAIISFSFDRSLNPDLTSDASGVISGNKIYVTVPYGTDTSSLTPSINMVGTSINPGKNEERSFTSESYYTVEAEDGTTTKYTVIVIQGSGDSKNILSFAFTDALNGAISHDIYGTITDNTVDIILPAGTTLGTFIPTIAVSGLSVSPDTLTPTDFSAPPVAYTVTAINGTTKTYNVNVTVSSDVTNPTVSTPALSAGANTPVSIDFSWSKATDDVSAQANLQYKLVHSAAAIPDVATANALSGSDIAMDWTTDTAAYQAIDLTSDTWYYFNLLVRDEGGNMALYNQEYIKTAIDVAPVIPNGTISSANISSTTMDLSWNDATDDVTALVSLQYKLVRSATTIPDVATANALSGSDIVMDWTAGTTSATAASLTPNTWYFFNVLVRDELHNMSLYNMTNLQTLTDTVPPGTPNSTITAGTITETTVALSWTDATDDFSAQANLSYKLVRSQLAIPDVTTANNLTGSDIVMDWTVNTTSATAGSLAYNTSYNFNVLVRDEANNVSVYTATSQTTLDDTTAPSTPNSTITTSNITETSVDLSWNDASDDLTATASLEYKVVRSTSSVPDLTTANALTGSDIVMDWTANTTSVTASSLAYNTTYYFNVLVRDAELNDAIYSMANSTTLNDTTAPTLSGGSTISSANITSISMDLSWNEATDDLASSLEYKLVRSTSAIPDIATANALSGSDIVMDWTTDATSDTAAGLTNNTVYNFRLLVRDTAGNMTLYDNLNEQTLLDGGAPTINDLTITTTGASQSTISLSWNDASDDVSLITSLQYKVVRSTSPITTISAAQAILSPDIIMDWTQNTKNATAHSMPQDTWYYFNVLVRDEAGNMSLYTQHQEKTFMDFSTNMIGQYIFNNDYTDISSTGNDLTLAGSLSFVNNRAASPNAALRFDTGTNHVYASNHASLNPGNELSISLWVNLDDINSDQKIIGKVNTSINRGYVLAVRNGKIYIEVWDDIGLYYSVDVAGNTVPLSTGTWIHLAMTWETNGELRAYIGGEEVGSTSAGANPIGTNGDNLVIGVCPWNTGANLMIKNGTVDDVRMYSVALSSYEVYTLSTWSAD